MPIPKSKFELKPHRPTFAISKDKTRLTNRTQQSYDTVSDCFDIEGRQTVEKSSAQFQLHSEHLEQFNASYVHNGHEAEPDSIPCPTPIWLNWKNRRACLYVKLM